MHGDAPFPSKNSIEPFFCLPRRSHGNALPPGASRSCFDLGKETQERFGVARAVHDEEVGLGVHPSSEAGRVFRDALGELNQAVAAVADQVLLVVAGRTLRLD